MPDDQGLQDGKYCVGIKQTSKMVEQGYAVEVYVAKDADPRLTAKLIAQCEKNRIPVVFVETMKLLGRNCGIEVGAAVAAVVNK